MNLGARASGIGTLADPTRRRLYGYVARQQEPVGREQAAKALDIAPHNVNFHLDKLVEEGLLEVEYRRLTGKTGPGAGRPSKLYRRADREFEVSLPPRRYDLMGEILATGITRSRTGEGLDEALRAAANSEGVTVGAASRDPNLTSDLNDLAAVLDRNGYEPHVDGHGLVLSNCPFHALADRHRTLVCSLNRDYVQGVADGLGCADADVRLEPGSRRCCVTVRPTGDFGTTTT